jgi:hypothetical protein
VRLLYGVNPDIDYGLKSQEIIRIPFCDEGMHLGQVLKRNRNHQVTIGKPALKNRTELPDNETISVLSCNPVQRE